MKPNLPTHSLKATSTSESNTRRSFREISRGYFKREAVETFMTELAFFSVITIIAVFGLIICGEALAHSLRAASMT